MNKRAGLDADCFAHDRDLLRVDEAQTLLNGTVSTVPAVEDVDLFDAAGRFLARDLVCEKRVPLFDHAAMDGFALVAPGEDMTRFVIRDQVLAGDGRSLRLSAGEAVRIMTGAPVPEGTRCVSLLEDSEEQGGVVLVPGGLKEGVNIRRSGEDMLPGDVMAKRGHRLTAADLGLASGLGFSRLPVFSPLSIGLCSSGTEVRPPGTELGPGQIHDVNRPLLSALLKKMGFLVSDAGILADHRDQVKAKLLKLAEQHDVILTTGGASRGDRDHMAESLAAVGSLQGWRIAMKPGKPLGFGTIPRSDGTQAVVILLPGNPVAAVMGTLLFAGPCLVRLSGGAWPVARCFSVPAGFSCKKKPGRREYLMVRLDGGKAMLAGPQGSAMMSTLAAADGFVDLPEDSTGVSEGEPVDYYPFSGFAPSPV